MAVEIKSGVSADLLTIDATSKAARVTLYNTDGTPIIPATTPKIYYTTTAGMTLATLAANSCACALTNPAASGRVIYVLRCLITTCFSGTAAATYVPYTLSRGTGTPGGGTANKSGATIGKRNPSDDNSIATFYYGPAAVTGLTDDSAANFAGCLIGHQVGQIDSIDLLPISIKTNDYLRDGFIISAGTSLTLRNRLISVAGTNLTVTMVWAEV